MKKLILAVLAVLIMSSGAWAEKQPCTQPGCDDHDGDFTFNDDLAVTGTVTAPTIRDSAAIIPNHLFMDLGAENISLRPHPHADNPVWEVSDVTDNCLAAGVPDFVADPFIFYEDGTWYMFYEVACNSVGDSKNYIAYLTSPDGLTWTEGNSGTPVVQDQGASGKNYAFPFVFKYDGEYYIIPTASATIDIWKATTFPTTWSKVETLCSSGCDTTLASALDAYADIVMFPFQDKWWIVYANNFTGSSTNDTFAWWSTEPIGGTWTAHTDATGGGVGQIKDADLAASRPAGRPIVKDDYVIFFYQDGAAHYADSVRAYKWTTLDPDVFVETEITNSPVLEENFLESWRSKGMHTIDIWNTNMGNPIAVTDGHDTADGSGGYSIGIFELSSPKTTDRITMRAGEAVGVDYYVKTLANDADDTCDLGTDCFQLPLPTSTSIISCGTYGGVGDRLQTIFVAEENGATVEVTDTLNLASTTLGTADSLNIYDGGTNTNIINELGASVIVVCSVVHD